MNAMKKIIIIVFLVLGKKKGYMTENGIRVNLRMTSIKKKIKNALKRDLGKQIKWEK